MYTECCICKVLLLIDVNAYLHNGKQIKTENIVDDEFVPSEGTIFMRLNKMYVIVGSLFCAHEVDLFGMTTIDHQQ